MDECICLKGVTFDRKYFHSATLVRPGEEAGEKYSGTLTMALNFIVPNIAGNQGVLKTMFLKEDNPIGTVDLYLTLLEALKYIASESGATVGIIVNRDDLIGELLTADEKALSNVQKDEKDLPLTVPEVAEEGEK